MLLNEYMNAWDSVNCLGSSTDQWQLSLSLNRPHAAATANSLQSCPTLCDPIDGSPPVSPVPGILQARTLEWVAISFSNAWKWKVKVKLLSHVRLFATPWTAAYQAPPSMGFSRQEYWSEVPLPSPGQGGLVCCNSWGCKESDRTERLKWTEVNQSEECLWWAH